MRRSSVLHKILVPRGHRQLLGGHGDVPEPISFKGKCLALQAAERTLNRTTSPFLLTAPNLWTRPYGTLNHVRNSGIMALKLNIIIGSTRPGRVGPVIARWISEAAIEHGKFDVELVDLADFGSASAG